MATKKGDSHLKKKESTKEKNVWLNEHGAYVDYSDTACAPCKDFYHVFVTPTQRLAGDPTLQYLIGLAEGHVDYIDRIPDNVLEKMIAYLELEDIVRLGATSKKFRRLCNCDAVWEKIFRREVETPITPELEALAEKEGWKRLFYTNKLQLQMQLRRQKRHDEHAFVTEGQQSMETS
ncbi:FBX36-like protein [Mya arenaria]|uniref:FBX36-like protein n=1 Tax=Mya arenaria TaxID=6604 RepID=A0ABY7G3E8_MYAAR|nr:FBX36-like protein [Mya arenaria]